MCSLLKSQILDQQQIDKRQAYLEQRIAHMEAAIHEEQEKAQRLEEEREQMVAGNVRAENESRERLDALKRTLSEMRDQVEAHEH